MTHYKLNDDHSIEPCDLMTWAMSYEKGGNRQVAHTVVSPDVRVSTVFLGMDHRFGGGGDPILFETMIFGGYHDQYQERYRTWDEASAGHGVAVTLASKSAEKGQ